MRKTYQVNDGGFVGVSGVAVTPEVYRVVEMGYYVIAPRIQQGADSQLLPRLPVSQGDIGIKNGRLHHRFEGFSLGTGQLGAQVWNHLVVASEDATSGPYTVRLPPAHIGDSHAARRPRGAIVFYTNGCTLEADANVRVRSIEFRIIKGSQHQVFYCGSRSYIGNHATYKHASHRGIAIRKMIGRGGLGARFKPATQPVTIAAATGGID
jgi:hypothetical protein